MKTIVQLRSNLGNPTFFDMRTSSSIAKKNNFLAKQRMKKIKSAALEPK